MNKAIVLVFFALVVTWQEVLSQEDVEKKVLQYSQWMSDGSEQKLWTAALRLEELGKEAIPVLKREIGNMPEVARVACAKALINMGETDYGIETLLEVVDKGKVLNARLDAVSLIGNYGDFEIEERLDQILEASYNSHLKIALAKALWQVARNPKAARILKSFLEVEDVEIRYAAALALAETNNVEAAKPVLFKLKDEPTLRGRIAKTFLEQDTLVNRYERLLEVQGTEKPPAKHECALIEEVVEKIRQYHVRGNEFATEALIDAAVKGMVLSCDIHSAFWTEKEWSDFVDHIVDEEYVGIGIYVGDRNGDLFVLSPIYSGPAYRAGIRSRDKIIEINGWPTRGKGIDEIMNKIRGDPGTALKLTVYRDGWSKSRDIEISREKIKIPTVFSELLPGQIGYLRLTQFGRKATENIEESLKEMEGRGMNGLILDLRGNAGGWLRTAVDIADKFLPQGQLIVYSEGRHPVKGQKHSYYSTDVDTHPDYPLVILVDGSSASASEIVAGALQVHKRAVIIGARTFGKGSVQEPLELENRPETRLKLTVAYYYLPDGRCIHNLMDSSGAITQHNGIVPDVSVDAEEWESWKNEIFTKLEEERKFQEYLDKYYDTNKALLSRLAEGDNADGDTYPDFQNWYRSLNTMASADDVRRWLRMHVRQRVADERGKEFSCDFEEDVMLQRAIVEICDKLTIDPQKIEMYRVFAKKFQPK